MSKPEDIPQDVWLTAGDVIAATWALDLYPQEMIARAIMAATTAEREACALEAVKFSTTLAARTSPPRSALSDLVFSSTATTADEIAAAIRKRGDVNTAHKIQNQED